MIKIGITGIIGSGKTTVSNILKRLGFSVVDLDQEAKKTLNSKEVLEEIKERLGEEMVGDAGIDVARIRNRVFSDKQALLTLEEIIHPRVRAQMYKKISNAEQDGKRSVIIDGPLLFETGLYKTMDKLIVVSADETITTGRLKERGLVEEDIERRRANQIPLREKERAADYIIYNNGTKQELEKEVEILLGKIRKWEEA